MEYYSAIKKNNIMSSAAPWMELETLNLSEISERERQIPYDITYNCNLIYSTNKHFHRKENHRLGDRLWLPRGRGRKWEGSGTWG